MSDKVLYGLLLIVFLASCKREIQINIDNQPSKLVVDGSLFQDSAIKVYLSETQNITDNSPKRVVLNAVIEVFDADTSLIDVLNELGNGVYASGFYQPKLGTQYLFRIRQNKQDYWVNEWMPDTFKSRITDTSRIVFQGKQDFFQITLNLKDDALKDNYYGLKVKRYFKQINGTDTQKLSEWVKLESIDFILTEDPQTKFSNQHLVFTDRYFNGTIQDLKFGAAELFSTANQHTEALEVYISSYSKNGYDYYSSVNEHLFYQNDPFSQPTLIRGNVPGAYGGIIGQNTSKFLIEF